MAKKIGDIVQSDWNNDDWDDWGEVEETNSLEGNIRGNDQIDNIIRKDTDLNSHATTSEKISVQNQKSSWSSLWGTVISTATDLTSTMNQVIGAPPPEEMARINATNLSESAGANETPDDNNSKHISDAKTPAFGLGLVSGVTTLGSKVLNTGLDTLEGIGKKTMNILQENDPLLKSKRKLLSLEPEKPNLSEILKEAKTDAERLENTLKELKIQKTKQMLRFDVLFENYCGLVHLEALEILSKESALKLQSLMDAVSGNALNELQETIKEVKELMELEDFESVESDGKYNGSELKENLKKTLEDVNFQINFDDIINAWTKSMEWIASSSAQASEQEVFAQGITALAETCALQMNKLHKIAEMLLVQTHHSTANEVDSIVQLTKQFNQHLNGLTNQYAAILTTTVSDEGKSKINTLFGEMIVATQQIQKAMDFFLPILQIGAV